MVDSPYCINVLSKNNNFKCAQDLRKKIEYESRLGFELGNMALLLGLDIDPNLSLGTSVLYPNHNGF